MTSFMRLPLSVPKVVLCVSLTLWGSLFSLSAIGHAKTDRDNYLKARETSLAAAMEVRKELFNSKCGGRLKWEHCYEGGGLPGEGLMPMHMWSNPVDDDWVFQSFREEVMPYQVDSSTGITYLKSERISRLAKDKNGNFLLDKNGKNKLAPNNGPAWIHKYAEEIDKESGIDILISLRIPNPTVHNRDRVALIYKGTNHKIYLTFNGNNITLFGDKVWDNNGTLDLTRDFQVFRIKKEPLSETVKVYYYGSSKKWRSNRNQAVLSATAQPSNMQYNNTPSSINFGMFNAHNTPDGEAHGNYHLDYLRFGRANRNLVEREVPPLPRVERLSRNNMTIWDEAWVLDSMEMPDDFQSSILRINTFSDTDKMYQGAGMIKGIYPGSSQLDGFSMEWQMRFKEGFDGAHRMSFRLPARSATEPRKRQLPGVNYSFILDRASIRRNAPYKPGSSVSFPHTLDLNQFQCFRFVKTPNTMYGQLYVNNYPVALLPDIFPGYNSADSYKGVEGGRIYFGEKQNNLPLSSKSAWAESNDFDAEIGIKPTQVEMKYLRISQDTKAPHPRNYSCGN